MNETADAVGTVAEPQASPPEQTSASSSNEERIARIAAGVWVPHAQTAAILQIMRGLLAAPNQVRADNLAIIGEPNSGKSALLDRFYEKHQSAYDPTVDDPQVAIWRIEMPESPDPPAVLRELLRTVGAQHSARDPSDVLVHRVKVLAESLNVRLFVIDEVHNGFRGTKRQQQILLNVLRGLSNKTRRPVVIAGTKEVENFLDYDDQLSERYLRRRLPSWKENLQTQQLLKGFEKEFALKNPSGLASPAMTESILRLSGSRLGRIAKLLRNAAIEAILSGTEKITEENLKESAKLLTSDD